MLEYGVAGSMKLTRSEARARALALPRLRGLPRSRSDVTLRRRLAVAARVAGVQALAAWALFDIPESIELHARAADLWDAYDALRSPRAPVRKRPNRVAKKILRRGGSAHYTVR